MRQWKARNRWVFLSTVLLLVLPASAYALEHSFADHFTTTAYRDDSSTTARWDVSTPGRLELWPFHMSLAGSKWSDVVPYGVAVSGDYAYVTLRGSGLAVVNISDPGAPVQVGACVTLGGAWAVAVDGDYAYLADGAGGLKVIDISVPASPVVVSVCSEGFDARGVAVSGDYAYVACATSGLRVIDISDPDNPALVGGHDTPGLAVEVAVSGDYAYVADSQSGLQVMDISDPTAPDLAGTFATADSVKGVAISGDCAFLAVYGEGLEILDITNPLSPSLKGQYNTPGRCTGIEVSGDRAYVADGQSGLEAIGISNPAEPVFGDSCDSPGSTYKVVVSGGYAYATDSDQGLLVIKVAEPVVPPLFVAELGLGDPGTALDVAGDYACVAVGARLSVVDISSPASPSVAASYGPITGTFTGVVCSGDYLYASNTGTGFQVLDISDPMYPDSAGSCYITGGGNGIFVSGNYAYVTTGTSGLKAVDISLPFAPSVAGSCSLAVTGNGLVVSGDYAYVASGGGLLVVDISDPTAPSQVGSCGTPTAAWSVSVSGDYAYVAAGASGLVAIDISDPTSPNAVGGCLTSGSVRSVAVSGNYAYLGDEGKFYTANITDPTDPVLVGECSTVGECRGIVVSGEHTYVADYSGFFEVRQVYEHQFDLQRNRGQSIAFFQSEDEISAARVFPAQVDLVCWYVSADSGASWSQVPTDGQWHALSSPGHDLMWRTEHYYRAYGVNPACDFVELQWKYDFAEIDSVKDIPEDEGGWVRLRFNRSGLDFPAPERVRSDDGEGGIVSDPSERVTTDGGTFGVNATTTVNTYFAHRRIDDIGFIEKLLEKGNRVEEDRPAAVDSWDGIDGAVEMPSSIGDAPAYVMGGHYYYVSQGSGGFPPGVWEAVGSVPATQQDQYYCLVSTRADSMSTFEYSVYCVTTHTGAASTYFVSPPDSGYSKDNLPPGSPRDLGGEFTYPPSMLHISWLKNSEHDFSHYAIYKGTSEDFVPGESNRIGTAWDTSFVDDQFDPNTNNYYKVTAWDIHENEGGWGLLTPEGISGSEQPPAVPTVALLEQNVPNPFNPVTAIRFSTSHSGRVALRVYDVTGRPVRTLVQEIRGAGRYEVKWDGRDDNGRGVPSGVYLYRLEAPWYGETRKMVLIK
ncbi:MAG: hypothetical protein NTX17_05485 [Candidatus Eisenbacteria bacterium]|nr:hypothetical protein [Candidatus Eisenbacteria bacterium]